MKRYGGVSNSVALDDVQEATVSCRPAVQFRWWNVTLGVIVACIKLLPTTLLFMLGMWGVSLVILWICG